MRLETSLKRVAEAIRKTREIYSCAKLCGITAREIDNEVREMRQTTLANCPNWAWSEATGYERAIRDSLYESSLVFGGFVDGVFYSTHRDRADYYEKNGIQPSEYADNGKVKNRGYYWKTTETPKPYFIG